MRSSLCTCVTISCKTNLSCDSPWPWISRVLVVCSGLFASYLVQSYVTTLSAGMLYDFITRLQLELFIPCVSSVRIVLFRYSPPTWILGLLPTRLQSCLKLHYTNKRLQQFLTKADFAFSLLFDDGIAESSGTVEFSATL